MNRLSTYFVASCIICGYCNVAVAGTSIISNVLTQSNSYLKEAGLVQKKYSGIAREYASMKVGIPDNPVSGQIAAASAQARGVQEQAERMQEQIAAAQEAQANAMARVNDLNTSMVNAMAQAQAGLNEGLAITESFKTSITQAVDTVKSAPDLAKGLADKMVNTVKDTAMGTVDSLKDTANSVKDQAVGIAKDSKEIAGKGSSSSQSTETIDNGNYASADDASEMYNESENGGVSQEIPNETIQGYRQPIGTSQVYQDAAIPQVVQGAVMSVSQPTAIVQSVQPEVRAIPVSNRADAIRSAAAMADTPVSVPQTMPAMDNLQIMTETETSVSAADVMAAAAAKPVDAVKEEAQRSKLNVEEQLLQTSNHVELNKMRRVEAKKAAKSKIKAKLATEKTPAATVKRRQFGVLETVEKAKPITAEVKKIESNPAVIQKQAIIKESNNE